MSHRKLGLKVTLERVRESRRLYTFHITNITVAERQGYPDVAGTKSTTTQHQLDNDIATVKGNRAAHDRNKANT